MSLLLRISKWAGIIILLCAMVAGLLAGIWIWRVNGHAEHIYRENSAHSVLIERGAHPTIEKAEWMMLSASKGRPINSPQDLCAPAEQPDETCKVGDIPVRLANWMVTESSNQRQNLARILLVRKLEARHSPEALIRIYLDMSYFGFDTLGVENASRTLFQKDVTDLSAREAVAIGMLLRQPRLHLRPADWMRRTDDMLLELGVTTP